MLRDMTVEEFKYLYHRDITRDFPPDEHPPYAEMRRQIACGITEALLFMDEEGGARGYIVASSSHPNGYVLITLLAIFADERGGGHGSRLLAELQKHYAGKRGLLLEVERPQDATNDAESIARKRRIAFYLRADYRLLEQLEYSIWGVPMHAMALPLIGPPESDAAYALRYQEIYRTLLGKSFPSQLQVRVLPEIENP